MFLSNDVVFSGWAWATEQGIQETCVAWIEKLEEGLMDSMRLSYHYDDGYLIKANKLCILCTQVRDFLAREVHMGGLAGNFGCNNTTEELEHNSTSQALSEMSSR